MIMERNFLNWFDDKRFPIQKENRIVGEIRVKEREQVV